MLLTVGRKECVRRWGRPQTYHTNLEPLPDLYCGSRWMLKWTSNVLKEFGNTRMLTIGQRINLGFDASSKNLVNKQCCSLVSLFHANEGKGKPTEVKNGEMIEAIRKCDANGK